MKIVVLEKLEVRLMTRNALECCQCEGYPIHVLLVPSESQILVRFALRISNIFALFRFPIGSNLKFQYFNIFHFSFKL